ncbi:histidine kinase [Micromonospora polyrhachis]|uniref:histidine kinase n=1 Tax=Micromonospora polyrhachis TaxID=1282883 RepID=A0A7W7ST69_9ACTN|nr:histidine kinase [Micromonospora polyrhachis]MBB4959907.1 signal transduction histidine kinase [Micromonospora polyrhachis]
MTRRNLTIDAGVAGLVFGATLALLAARGFGSPYPGARGLDVTGVVLAAFASLPLAVRRIRALTAYLVIAVATLVLLWLGYSLDGPFGVAVATYGVSVAYSGDRRRARRAVAMLAIVGFLVAVAVGYAAAGLSGRAMVTLLLVWPAFFVGLWIAGDRTRLRQERIAALAERARRADREAQRERRLAAARERTRIARELHDSAGHAINVILVQAGAARLLHDRDPERSRAAIGAIEQVARNMIGEIDRLVGALREDDGTDGSSVPADPSALDELLGQYEAAGLQITADVSGTRGVLPPSVAWAAYRILQEALTNAVRHGTGTADVAIEFGPEAVEIAVANPVRRGGDADRLGAEGAVGRAGHGIVGMRERALLLGGTLDVAGDRRSFRLAARLPHARPAEGFRSAAPVRLAAELRPVGELRPFGELRDDAGRREVAS